MRQITFSGNPPDPHLPCATATLKGHRVKLSGMMRHFRHGIHGECARCGSDSRCRRTGWMAIGDFFCSTFLIQHVYLSAFEPIYQIKELAIKRTRTPVSHTHINGETNLIISKHQRAQTALSVEIQRQAKRTRDRHGQQRQKTRADKTLKMN